jgi:hypothetical protein
MFSLAIVIPRIPGTMTEIRRAVRANNDANFLPLTHVERGFDSQFAQEL